MADWNRANYDQIESERRWKIAVISRDPIAGVPPGLVAFLGASLVLLAFWR